MASMRWPFSVALIASALVLAACSEQPETPQPVAETEAVAAGPTVEIADNEGTKTVPFQPTRISAADPRIAELLRGLGVTPVDSNPQLVIMGSETESDTQAGVPVVDLSPRDDLPFDWELVRQVQVLGQILGKEEQAAQLDDDFSEALVLAKSRRHSSTKFGLLETDGKRVQEPSDAAHALWDPVVTMLDLRLAEDDAPDALLVYDREPDFKAKEYASSQRLIDDLGEDNPLATSPAVKNGNVYVAPLNAAAPASIITYTLLFNELADHWTRNK